MGKYKTRNNSTAETMMEARQRGKYQRKKMEGRVGEQKKIKPKLLDAVRKKQNEIQNPSEKPPTFTGRVDLTKGASTPKRTTFKKPSEKPNLDPKKNTITDYDEFQKTKPVDSKTRKRMNAPENQFNSYNPLHEDRKTFDKYMKDARGKKPEEKLPLLRKATKIHKELPDEDKK